VNVEITAERVARNDSTFRLANEGIASSAADLDIDRVPCICECADRRCTAVISLSPSEYEQVRADPTHFVNVPGHEASAGGYVQVIERHDGYVVVEKRGEAAKLTTELDPRRGRLSRRRG
jgi:hypothetical protein